MKYQLIIAPVRHLEARVQVALGQGWELLGCPFYTGNQVKINCYESKYDLVAELAQAVIKSK